MTKASKLQKRKKTPHDFRRLNEILQQGQTIQTKGKFPISISSSNFLVPLWFSEKANQEINTEYKEKGTKNEISSHQRKNSLLSLGLTPFIISYICSVFSRGFTFQDPIDHINLWLSDGSPWISIISIARELVKKACNQSCSNQMDQKFQGGAQQSVL